MVAIAPPIGSPRALEAIGYTGSTWDQPAFLPRGQLTTAERMPTAELLPGADAAWIPPGPAFDLTALTFVDPLTGRDMSGSQFLDRRLHTDALLVVHRGKLIYETYRNAMTEHDRHVNHSTTKTLTSMLVGIAVADGAVELTAPMGVLVPELAEIPAWRGVTLQHVLDMSAGLDTEEHYENTDSMYWRYAAAVGYYWSAPEQQIGTLGFAQAELTRRIEPPGWRFNYASYLTNLIPIAIENACGRPALEMLEERIYQHLGAELSALLNVDRQDHPIVEGQLNLTLRDFARWSMPFAREGLSLTGKRVVPSDWIDQTFARSDERREAFLRSESSEVFDFPDVQYHNQAWVLDPGRRTMAMLGIHGQFSYIDLTSDLMIVGYASFPTQTHGVLTASMVQLWAKVTLAVD
jgi:hypothetical protein